MQSNVCGAGAATPGECRYEEEARRDETCRHSQTLDLMGLAERYGPTVPLALIVRRLRCTVCGAREPEITIGSEPRG